MPSASRLALAPTTAVSGSSRTTMFVADEHATAAYVLRHGKLARAWIAETPGTSPVMAGGLLYVYDPSGGGIVVYRPNSPKPLDKLLGDEAEISPECFLHDPAVERAGEDRPEPLPVGRPAFPHRRHRDHSRSAEQGRGAPRRRGHLRPGA